MHEWDHEDIGSLRELGYFTKQEKQIKETVELDYFLSSEVYMALPMQRHIITAWNSEYKTEGREDYHRLGF